MAAINAFEDWAQRMRAHFETVAEGALPQPEGALAPLAEAMRYAVLGGGKRARALFVYASGIITHAHPAHLDAAAAAIEFIHAYSLVHDDMPCMDNDTLRRGKPTVHVQFGEAMALLTGDALTPAAFSLLAHMDAAPETKAALITQLADASGFWGMCGGQAIDLMHVGCSMEMAQLRQMHRLKTGALIVASVRMGALCGQSDIARAVMPHLDTYAEAIGLGFQVVDDILDVTSDAATLGKTAGKDAAHDKPTYVSLLGLDQARQLARQCHDSALDALEAMQGHPAVAAHATERLAQLAHYVIGRNY